MTDIDGQINPENKVAYEFLLGLLLANSMSDDQTERDILSEAIRHFTLEYQARLPETIYLEDIYRLVLSRENILFIPKRLFGKKDFMIVKRRGEKGLAVRPRSDRETGSGWIRLLSPRPELKVAPNKTLCYHIVLFILKKVGIRKMRQFGVFLSHISEIMRHFGLKVSHSQRQWLVLRGIRLFDKTKSEG